MFPLELYKEIFFVVAFKDLKYEYEPIMICKRIKTIPIIEYKI